jgi:hypothetical protein
VFDELRREGILPGCRIVEFGDICAPGGAIETMSLNFSNKRAGFSGCVSDGTMLSSQDPLWLLFWISLPRANAGASFLCACDVAAFTRTIAPVPTVAMV